MDFIKDRLLKLNAITEEDVERIWPNHTLDIDGNSTEPNRMVVRFQNAADVVMFWNALDPNKRGRLLHHFGANEYALRVLGIKSGGIHPMDFFVWMANSQCEWRHGRLLSKPITTFFDASEDQQHAWLKEYEEIMTGYE